MNVLNFLPQWSIMDEPDPGRWSPKVRINTLTKNLLPSQRVISFRLALESEKQA